jgi:hypothetical protein
MCLSCVWPTIGSAPGGHTDIRPVSLEAVWPEWVPSVEISFKKWTLAELAKRKITQTMLSNGKN